MATGAFKLSSITQDGRRSGFPSAFREPPATPSKNSYRALSTPSPNCNRATQFCRLASGRAAPGKSRTTDGSAFDFQRLTRFRAVYLPRSPCGSVESPVGRLTDSVCIFFDRGGRIADTTSDPYGRNLGRENPYCRSKLSSAHDFAGGDSPFGEPGSCCGSARWLAGVPPDILGTILFIV